jgi:hydrogenase 3 maturation protease
VNGIDQIIETLKSPESMVVIGLGNPDRSDDGFGIIVADRLKTQFPDHVFSERDRSVESLSLEALERKEIEVILFLDAVDFGGKPGEYQLFTEQNIHQFVPALTTHKVPISLIMKLIMEHKKKPYLFGVQPQSLTLFGGLSPVIQKVVDELTEELRGLLSVCWASG